MQIIKLINEGRFYKSRYWKKKRAEILDRDNYECQVCRAEGKVSPANTVHHIIPLEQRPDLVLDDDNLLSICAGCHNREHPEKFIHVIRRLKCKKLEARFPERW